MPIFARIRRLLPLLTVLAPLALARPARAEGQNKVQYRQYDWKVYASPHFDIHYYPEEEQLLEAVLSDAESAYKDISEFLGHEPPFRIPLIYYRTHADFEQTNVIMEFIPEAVGGFTDTLRNRMVIPVDQAPDARYRLIRHELTHVFSNSILYEQSIGRMVRGQAPLWMTEGLAEHMAKKAGADPFDDMYLRDAALNGLIPSVRDLDGYGFMTYRFGEAVFGFISEDKGKEAVANFLWEYRRALVGGSLEKALKDAFGMSIPEFDQAFRRWLRKRYLPLAVTRDEPMDYGPEIRSKEDQERPGLVFISPALSPSGDLVAAITNRRFGTVDVVVLSAKDGKVLHTLTPHFTNKWDGLAIHGFEGRHDLGWSPDGDSVAFIVRREGERELVIAPVRGWGGERRIKLRWQEEPLANAQSPAFSPDGKRVAFSANYNGRVDLFYADLDNREIGRLTDDPVEDYNPRWSADGRQMLYNAKIGAHDKLFLVDTADPTRKTQLTFDDADDIMPGFSGDGKAVLFSSARAPDRIFDLYRLDLASGARQRLSHVTSGVFGAVETGRAPPTPPAVKPADRGPLKAREKRGEAPAEAKPDASAPADAPPAGAAAPVAPEGLPSEIVFATFNRGTYAIVQGRRFKVEEELPPAQSADTGGETAAYQPPIQLTPDAANSKPYAPLSAKNWAVEYPQIEVGVYGDGLLVYSGSVVFADQLGDQRVAVVANSVDGFTNIEATYLNRKRRLGWGAGAFDNRNYYYVVRAEDGAIVRLENHQSGAFGFAEYPLTRRLRVDAGMGYLGRKQFDFAGFEFDPYYGFTSVGEDRKSSGPFVSAGVSYDSARYYEPAWAIQGFKADLEVRKGLGSADYLEYSVTLRKYQNIAGRSLIAWRGVYQGASGKDLNYLSLGGYNTLRGYSYAEFFGTQMFFSNLEFRLPLADHIVLPWLGGLDLRGQRLALFFDAGATWLRAKDLSVNATALDGRIFVDPEGSLYSCYDYGPGGITPRDPLPPDCAIHEWSFWKPGRVGRELQDGRASYGFDWSFFLGQFELHWDYARRWSGQDSSGGFGTDFYIGYTW